MIGGWVHWYKKNLGDYAKKAGKLSLLQHGVYTILLDSCYDREKFPTRQEAIDWTWASTESEIEALDFILNKFFVLENGVFVQSRVQEEIEAYHATSTTNKRIAHERETKRREESTKRERGVNEACTNDERIVNEAPPNQEPVTSNQEPVTRKERERASRFSLNSLPNDWEDFCILERPELDPLKTFERFGDYWRAKAGRDGTKLDWLATWRNWVRNEKIFGDSKNGNTAKSKQDSNRKAIADACAIIEARQQNISASHERDDDAFQEFADDGRTDGDHV